MNTLISKSWSCENCAVESRALGRVCHGGREEIVTEVQASTTRSAFTARGGFYAEIDVLISSE